VRVHDLRYSLERKRTGDHGEGVKNTEIYVQT
jgi:hypothetical protein